MSEGENTQLDLEKGGSSSPAATQKMKVETEDSGNKVADSGSKGTVIKRCKDRFADQLLRYEGEDETDDEDDNESISPGGSSQSSVSESIDIFGTFQKDKPNGLLEKHENLLNLFNRMESSIRLLCLRKKMSTYKNIATQLMHYADMEITILMDPVECRSPDQSLSTTICEAFHSKLLRFLDAHHKDIDIPEAMLPEPFNSRDKLLLKAPQNGHSAEPLLQSSNENVFSNASHFPHSFQKLMSKKIIAEGTERTMLRSDPAELSTPSADDTEGPNKSKISMLPFLLLQIAI
ncbi:hypothetical protein ABZP36_029591 [Zizania latifolia]